MGPSVDWDDGFEWRAARDKRHTYAILRDGEQEFLFDNANDPRQTRNLIGLPEHAETRARLHSWTRSRMTDIGDTFETVTWYRDHWTVNGAIVAST